MTSESRMLEPPSTMPTTTWTGFLTVRWLLIGLMKKLPADPVRKWGPRASRTGPCWLPSTTSLEFKVRVTGGQGLDSPWPNFFLRGHQKGDNHRCASLEKAATFGRQHSMFKETLSNMEEETQRVDIDCLIHCTQNHPRCNKALLTVSGPTRKH